MALSSLRLHRASAPLRLLSALGLLCVTLSLSCSDGSSRRNGDASAGAGGQAGAAEEGGQGGRTGGNGGAGTAGGSGGQAGSSSASGTGGTAGEASSGGGTGAPPPIVTTCTHHFGPEASIPTPGGPYGMLAGDLNLDGDLDLVTQLDNNTQAVGILLGNGDGSFDDQVRLVPQGDRPRPLALLDTDDDGDPDLLYSASDADGHYFGVLLNDGTGSFPTEPAYRSPPAPYLPQHAVVADVDGDGKSEFLVVGNTTSTGVLRVYRGGPNPFIDETSYETEAAALFLLPVDLDRDGDLDLASSHGNTNEIAVWENDGTGNYAAPQIFNLGVRTTSVAASDLDWDGYPELIAGGGGSLAYLQNLGDGNFGTAKSIPGGGAHVVAADLDGNLTADLVMVTFGNTDLRVHLVDGQGVPLPMVKYPALYRPLDVIAADFNHDGLPDAVVSYEDDRVGLSLSQCD